MESASQTAAAMHDQADRLRQLVQSDSADGLVHAAPPPMVVVSGGKGGVGATSVAVNLAVSLARQGSRTTLVDANFHQPDVGTFCRLDGKESVAEILAGRRTINEVLQSGPAGIQILSGPWASRSATDFTTREQARLHKELSRLGPRTDVVVVDAGSGMRPDVRYFWHAADLVLLVTTAQSVSIMDAYAALKAVWADEEPGKPVWTVVNQLPGGEPHTGDDVHLRLRETCQRFLGVSVQPAVSIPTDPSVAEATLAGQPFAIREPGSPAARQLEVLARQVAKELAQGRPPTMLAG